MRCKIGELYRSKTTGKKVMFAVRPGSVELIVDGLVVEAHRGEECCTTAYQKYVVIEAFQEAAQLGELTAVEVYEPLPPKIAKVGDIVELLQDNGQAFCLPRYEVVVQCGDVLGSIPIAIRPSDSLVIPCTGRRARWVAAGSVSEGLCPSNPPVPVILTDY